MKKTPAIPFPAPGAGVVISEHPKSIGMQGTVDAKNFITHKGSLVTRPGLEYVVQPYIEPAWSGPGSTPDGEQILALASYDYQKEGEVTRDRLLVVMQSGATLYRSDYSWPQPVNVDNAYDWGWDRVYGSSIEDPSQLLVPTDDISISVTSVDGISWPSVWASNIYGVGISVFMNLVTSQMVIWLHPFYGGSMTSVVTCDVFKVDADDLEESGFVLTLTKNGNPLNLQVEFNATWDIYRQYVDEGASKVLGPGGYAKDSIPPTWYKVYYNSQYYGFPREVSASIKEEFKFDYDADDRPVLRAWDYGGETHILAAARGEWLMDIWGEPSPSVKAKTNTCGPPGVCPKALTIAIAGQRIVAGNIVFFNVEDMIADEDNADKILTKVNDGIYDRAYPILYNLDTTVGFAHVSDAVIFSQTVLQAGHLGWYPGDIIRLADTPGEVIALQEIGTMQCAVYKSDAIYVLTTQAGLSPFAPSLRASGIQGPVSSKCVVAVTDSTHVYLGRDGGVYIFDGGPPKGVGEHFKQWVSRELDPDYAHKSFGVFNKEDSQVIFMFPVRGSGGRVNRGIVVDVAGQPYKCHPIEFANKLSYNWSHVGQYEVDYTCATEHFESGQSIAPGDTMVPTTQPIGGSETTYQEFLFGVLDNSGTLPGRVFKLAEDGSDFGIPIEASFQTGMTDLGNPDQQKVMLEIEHMIDPKEEIYAGTEIKAVVTLYAGNSDRSLKQVEQQEVDLTGQPPYVSYHRTTARFFSYELKITCGAADPGTGSFQVPENSKRGKIAVGGGIARFKPTGYRNVGIEK